VHLAPLDGLPAWLEARTRQGILVDPKVYAGLFLLFPFPSRPFPVNNAWHAKIL